MTVLATDINWGPHPATAPTSEPFPEAWRLLDDVQLMSLPDPAFLVSGVIPERGVGVLYGLPGTGKTTLVADLALCVATGARWFGHPVLDAGPVVCVAAEDTSGLKVRLKAAKAAAGLKLSIPIGVFTFAEPFNLGDADSVARFLAFLSTQRFSSPLKLLVVDTYAAATPGASENSSEDTTTAMVHAQQLRDTLACAVLLVHHTNASGSRERGHSSMRGACDFMISMTPLDDLIHVECSKQRNGAPFDKITLKLVPAPDGQGCVMRLASDVLPSSGLTANERRAYDALRDGFRPEEGATKTEWLKVCTGMPDSTFYRVTKTLQDGGYVQTIGTRFRLTPKAVSR